jgi:hypothetical protein
MSSRELARMTLPARGHKLLLTVHVVVSVGLIGADSALVTLGLSSLTSGMPDLIRASYLSMELLVDTVLIPATIVALATGVLLALGTSWGLTRYYWVLGKFLLTIVALTALVTLLRPKVREAAFHASQASPVDLAATGIGQIGVGAAIRPVIAMMILLLIVTLAMYKPWGLIRTRRS